MWLALRLADGLRRTLRDRQVARLDMDDRTRGVDVGDNTQRQTSSQIGSGALAGVRAHGGRLYQQQRGRPCAPGGMPDGGLGVWSCAPIGLPVAGTIDGGVVPRQGAPSGPVGSLYPWAVGLRPVCLSNFQMAQSHPGRGCAQGCIVIATRPDWAHAPTMPTCNRAAERRVSAATAA